MRVVLLAGWYYPDSVGGTEAYVQSLAHDLQRLGHEVHVAAAADGDVERRYVHNGVSVYRYPVAVDASRAEVQGRVPPAHLDTFDRWIGEVEPDVVHVHSFTRGCSISHLRCVAARNVPIVLTVHTPDMVCARGTLLRWGEVPCDGVYDRSRCGACSIQARGIGRRTATLIAKHAPRIPTGVLPSRVRTALELPQLTELWRGNALDAFGLSSRVVAVSRWLHEMLAVDAVPREKLVLSPQGLTEEELASAAAVRPRRSSGGRSELVIGCLGRYKATKGTHVLIEAVRRLPPDVPIQLRVFGFASDAEGQRYRARIERLAAGDPRIQVRGELTRARRAAEMAEWDLLAVPSLWFETGPLVVLEAFAAGIPVIGSDIGGIPERVVHGESGWLVPPGDVGAWSTALAELGARFRAGEWSWRLPAIRSAAQVACEMDAIYRDLVPMGEAQPATDPNLARQVI